MTYQIRDSISYRGEKRSIGCLPLESYLRQSGRQIPQTGGTSTACWRGYVAEWALHAADDTLHLTHWLDSPPLAALFPDRQGNEAGSSSSIEASWFSGLIVADDVTDPDNSETVESYKRNGWPLHFTAFTLVIRRGKLLREELFDLTTDTVSEVRLTRHAGELFSGIELGFLQSICDEPGNGSLDAGGVYADWLEEQGDPRGELLRGALTKAAREESNAQRRRRLSSRRNRQDIPDGEADPEDRLWYWHQLVGIPECSSR